jgi:hypothetical protein
MHRLLVLAVAVLALSFVALARAAEHAPASSPAPAKLSSEMKPGAKLVVIEFKEGKLPEGPPEAVKIPKAKLVSMLESAGFSLQSDRPELLPYQTFLTFTKPAKSAAR